MPTWWGKSSSKEAKKKVGKESFIDTLHRKFRTASDGIAGSGARRRSGDTVSEKGSRSPAESRSPSPPSKQVARCQSFIERPQPLPLPNRNSPSVGRPDPGIDLSAKPRCEKRSESSAFSLPEPACSSRVNPTDLDSDLESDDNDDQAASHRRSPRAADYDVGLKAFAGNPSSVMLKDQHQPSNSSQISPRESKKPANRPSTNPVPTASPKRRPLSSHVPNLLVPFNGGFCSTPDSSRSSPSRSPMRGFGSEQAANSFWPGIGSGQCSSPGSGQNSGHNSMGGDMSGQLFWQQSKGSPEYSPVPSPRMTSPGPGSRIHSGAVTPVHPRAGGAPLESQTSHHLPLPPVVISNPSPFSHSNSAAVSPSVPRSPGRSENPPSPGSRWKKGKLLGRGTFGHVYVGFNSENGDMCAMKEVTLFSDDAKSKESAKQLMQEISLLSRLRHQNIVQYYGSESLGDKLYIYLEYVSGGSIYKLLQDYGQFGELAIRSYTQQILSGLAYLHAKNTVHRSPFKGWKGFRVPMLTTRSTASSHGRLAFGSPFCEICYAVGEADYEP